MKKEVFFEALVNNHSDAIQVMDLDGNLVFLNHAAKERMGVNMRKDLLLNISEFEPLFKSEQIWKEHVTEILKAEKRVIIRNCTNRTTGETIPVEVTESIVQINGEKHIFSLSRDIRDREEIQKRLNLRERILVAISDSTTELLFNPNTQEAIARVLRIIGEAVDVDRTYLFDYYNTPETGEVISQRYEWNSGGAEPQIDNPELQNVPVELFEDFMSTLKQNRPYQAIVSELPDEMQLKAILEPQEIISFLVIPIFLGGRFFGFVGYDDCHQKRIWSDSELSILQTLANNISIALEREKQQQEIENLALFPLQNPAPILRLSTTGDILLKNAAAKELFHAPVWIKGREFTFADFKEFILKAVSPAETTQSISIKTSTDTYFSVTIKLIHEKSYINLYFNDITLLKETQETLRNTRKTTEEIIQQMEDVIWSINFPDYTSLFISPSIEKLSGIPISEFMRDYKVWESIIVPEDRYVITKINEELTKKGESEAEYRVQTDSGIKWVNNRARVIYNSENSPVRIDGYIRDITQRKQFDESLRFQEEKYRRIIANMNLGLLEVDLNDIILFVNDSFCEMSGYRVEQLIGQNAADLFLGEKELALIQKKKKERIQGKSDSYEIEVVDKGEKKWWLISGAPNYDKDGKLIGTIGIHLDITDQKKIQDELEKAKIRAESSDKAKEEFIMNMSHEIRTPLNAIVGLSNFLKNEDLPREKINMIEKIAVSGKHLQALIDNILDFSKISSGHLSIHPAPFDIYHLLENVKKIIEPLSEEKKLDFNIYIDTSLSPVLVGDEIRLRQILVNFLSNAVKFTDKGYVRLSVSQEHKEQAPNMIHFIIEDTGIGMSPDFQKRIFDKFTQEISSPTEKTSGTGLGMAISKEFISLMGGEILVQSEKDKGTQFTLTIPLEPGSLTTNELHRTENHEEELKNKTILIVEDNDINRLVVSSILNRKGARLLEAVNGLEALELLKTESVDCILMDVQMPKMNGYECTIAIRKELKLSTPIIGLSANAINTEINKCIEVGMNDYIVKPFAEKKLISSINKLLYSSPSSQEQEPENRPEQEVPEQLFNLEYINQLSHGNVSFRNEVLALFCKTLPEELTLIKNAIASKNMDTIEKVAHKIKPNLNNFGVHSIREDILFLNQLHSQKKLDWQEIEDRFEKVETTTLHVLSEFRKLLSE